MNGPLPYQAPSRSPCRRSRRIPTLLCLSGETTETDEPWRSQPSYHPEPVPAPARRRVLVAEDDPMVRTMIHRLLEEEGYEVRSGRHGDEALQIALRASGPFDLAITDVRMPVMDGWELGRRLRERWPDLPLLYISGYDVELTSANRRPGPTQALLRKPFDLDELIRQVKRLVREP